MSITRKSYDAGFPFGTPCGLFLWKNKTIRDMMPRLRITMGIKNVHLEFALSLIGKINQN